ncbi:alpha/beta hydrolase-fold protein [Candidatus Bipolaricaulota bacterium]
MLDQLSIESPRLQALKKELERGEAIALESFWEEMRERSTPLIEAIEGDDTQYLVTFVWRGDESIARCTLISLLTTRDKNVLQRLARTDLWFLSCAVESGIRATYQFFPESEEDLRHPITNPMERFAKYQHDPFNPKTYVFEKDEEDPDEFELTRSVLEMPDAVTQPLIEPKDGVPTGSLEMHRFKSEILENERRVWVYTPPGYDGDRSESYDVLVMFDGTGFAKMSQLTTILDNLIAPGDIPPLVAIMPCSLSQSLRLKELLLHEPFNEFLAKELMPWAHDTYHLTDDPTHVVVSGASAGGIAAAFAAFERPDLFGNVLSLSGAFMFSPGMLSPGWKGEHEWLARQIASTETRPIRFHLSYGSLETNSLRDVGTAPNLVLANRHLRTVLEAKGYPVWVSEFGGGHDMISWQGEIPAGLITLLGQQGS